MGGRAHMVFPCSLKVLRCSFDHWPLAAAMLALLSLRAMTIPSAFLVAFPRCTSFPRSILRP